MIRGFSNHASNPMNKKLTSMALAVSSCFGAGHAVADDDTRVLSPVVVTATRVEQDSFDLPMAIDKIERHPVLARRLGSAALAARSDHPACAG